MKLLKIFALIAVPLVILTCNSSCSPQRKIAKAKATLIASGELPKTCAELYPCKEGIPTVTVIRDTVENAKAVAALMQQLTELGADADRLIDSLKNNPDCTQYAQLLSALKAKGTPVKQKVITLPPIHDTVRVETKILDTAALEAEKREHAKTKAEMQKYKDFWDKHKGKVHIPLWLVILAALGTIYWAYQRIRAGALNTVVNTLKNKF